MLKKTELCGEEDFQKWSQVLVDHMMSNEESKDNESIIAKPLPWWSTFNLVNDF